MQSQMFLFQETAEIKHFQAYQKLCTFKKNNDEGEPSQ